MEGDRTANLRLIQWCAAAGCLASIGYIATPIFPAVFGIAVLDGAGGLAQPLFRRIISGLSPPERQGEVLSMFASIETVCQLSAGANPVSARVYM